MAYGASLLLISAISAIAYLLALHDLRAKPEPRAPGAAGFVPEIPKGDAAAGQADPVQQQETPQLAVGLEDISKGIDQSAKAGEPWRDPPRQTSPTATAHFLPAWLNPGSSTTQVD